MLTQWYFTQWACLENKEVKLWLEETNYQLNTAQSQGQVVTPVDLHLPTLAVGDQTCRNQELLLAMSLTRNVKWCLPCLRRNWVPWCKTCWSTSVIRHFGFQGFLNWENQKNRKKTWNVASWKPMSVFQETCLQGLARLSQDPWKSCLMPDPKIVKFANFPPDVASDIGFSQILYGHYLRHRCAQARLLALKDLEFWCNTVICNLSHHLFPFLPFQSHYQPFSSSHSMLQLPTLHQALHPHWDFWIICGLAGVYHVGLN